MSLTCPRCETDVSAEAQYCPYCSLPKPRNGFAAAQEANPEQIGSTEQAKPTLGLRGSNKEQNRSFSLPNNARSFKRQRSTTPRRLRLPVVSVAALVALLSVGIYIFVVPLVYSN